VRSLVREHRLLACQRSHGGKFPVGARDHFHRRAGLGHCVVQLRVRRQQCFELQLGDIPVRLVLEGGYFVASGQGDANSHGGKLGVEVRGVHRGVSKKIGGGVSKRCDTQVTQAAALFVACVS